MSERIGFLDIETTDLAANFGFMLSWCIKVLDSQVYDACITPKELHGDVLDRRILTSLLGQMRKFDRLIGFYSGPWRFDIPFIRARALYHNLDFPTYGSIWQTDLYPEVKRNLRLKSNRLGFTCDFLKIPSKNHPLAGDMWTRALTGHKDALQYVLEHNREDVVSTEALYKRLLPFMRRLRDGGLPRTSL